MSQLTKTQPEMTAPWRKCRSSGQPGSNRAHAIDLTNLNESDDEGISIIGKSSLKPRTKPDKPSLVPPHVSLSSEAVASSSKELEAKSTTKRHRESSSDDNDILMAIRKKKHRPKSDDIEKCKRPPSNEQNIATPNLASPHVSTAASSLTVRDNQRVNTSLLLKIDIDEFKGSKNHITHHHHHKTSRPKSNTLNVVADSHRGVDQPVTVPIHAHPDSHTQSSQRASLTNNTQAPIVKRNRSADITSSRHGATKIGQTRGKETLNTQSFHRPHLQRPGCSSATDAKPESDIPHILWSSVDDKKTVKDPPPSDGHHSTTWKASASREKSPKDRKALSHISEDKIHEAAAQFKALQAQQDPSRHTKLVDSKNITPRVAVSSNAYAGARSSQPCPPQTQPSMVRPSEVQDIVQSHPSLSLRPPTPPRSPKFPRVPPPQRPQGAPRSLQSPGTHQPLRVPQSSLQRGNTVEWLQARSRPLPKVPPIKNSEFENAAALIRTMQTQNSLRSPPKQTALINRMPTKLLEPQRPNPPFRNISIPRRNVQDPMSNLDYRARKRYRAIQLRLQKSHGHESEEFRAHLLDEKFHEYLARRPKTDALRDRTKNGDHPKVEDVEAKAYDPSDDDGENEEATSIGRVPLSQALEATQSGFVTQYAVFASGPHEACRGQAHGECLKRIKAFDQVDSANDFAELLLKAPPAPPKTSGKKGARPSKAQRGKPIPKFQIDSYQETYRDGMLSGLIKLRNGQSIVCEVRKEVQAVGNLSPHTLKRKWANGAFVETYRKRYDVWLIKVVPTAFAERAQRDKEAWAKRREEEKEEREKTEEGDKAATELHDDKEGQERVQKAEIITGLEGDELRAALARLPAPNDKNVPDNRTGNVEMKGNNNGIHQKEGEEKREQDELGEDDIVSEAGTDASTSSTSTLQPEERQPSSPPYHCRRDYFHSPNPWRCEEYIPLLCGSYTTLRLANEQAFRAAELEWKPRTARLAAVLHYKDEIKDAIDQERELTDLDNERVEIRFPVPKWHGHDDHRPWGFVYSCVMVHETVLEGPRDIGADFVQEEEEEAGEMRDNNTEVAHREQPETAAHPADAQDRSAAGHGDGEGEHVDLFAVSGDVCEAEN